MARVALRRKAIELRLQGNTYTEIRTELGLPKSTLSDWLSRYPLSQEQLTILKQKIKNSRLVAIEKTRIVKQKKREKRFQDVYEQEKKRWKSLKKRELELAGLFLYWGEGSKSLKGAISLNNTDPKVMRFTLFWLLHALNVPKDKIKVYLHLYNDMDVEKEMSFWSNELQLPLTQFTRPYIKNSQRTEIDHKGYGHGTCGLMVNNTRLREKVIMGIHAIADLCSEGK